MDGFHQDKLAERDRYNARAQTRLSGSASSTLGPDGAESQPLGIRTPYTVFEQEILRLAKPEGRALDVCCGTGLYSLIAAKAGSSVVATDIAERNLDLARLRAERAGIRLETACADAEALPFPNNSFNLATCAGSLSYVDFRRFVAEIRRVLKPGGAFVCVDSLNHNPVYRINRYIQYRRGRRTKATLLRMPTMSTITHLMDEFDDGRASFHGVAVFALPMLRRLFGELRAARCVDRFDALLPRARSWAFKFVFAGHRPG